MDKIDWGLIAGAVLASICSIAIVLTHIAAFPDALSTMVLALIGALFPAGAVLFSHKHITTPETKLIQKLVLLVSLGVSIFILVICWLCAKNMWDTVEKFGFRIALAVFFFGSAVIVVKVIKHHGNLSLRNRTQIQGGSVHMNRKKYKLYIGPQGVFYLLLPIICTVIVVSFSRPNWYKDGSAWIGFLIPTLSYLSLVILHLTLSSVRVVDHCIHIIFMGVTIRKIPIHQITKIEKTNLGFGYMALAKNKIVILCEKKNKTLISIKEDDDFLSQLNFNKNL